MDPQAQANTAVYSKKREIWFAEIQRAAALGLAMGYLNDLAEVYSGITCSPFAVIPFLASCAVAVAFGACGSAAGYDLTSAAKQGFVIKAHFREKNNNSISKQNQHQLRTSFSMTCLPAQPASLFPLRCCLCG
jgi:hypothetical protein